MAKDFDPDAYLASKTVSGSFDPDSYLASKEPTVSESDRASARAKRQGADYKSSISPYQTTSSFLHGLKEIPVGIGQLAVKGAEAVTSGFGLSPNKVSEAIGAEGERVRRQVELENALLENAREQRGDTGFDWARLGGNAVTGVVAAPIAVTTGGPVTAAMATGGIQALFQPTSSEDYWSTKAGQAALGAATGGVVVGGAKTVKGAYDILKGFTSSGREKAMVEYLNKLAGPERDTVIKALQDAKELVTGSRPTAAEVLADLPSATDLIAAQTKLAGKEGTAGLFNTRAVEQQTARQSALEKIAGTEGQREAVKLTRDRVTGALREESLSRADIAKEAVSNVKNQVMKGALQVVKQAEDMSGLPYPKANLEIQGQSQRITEAAQATAERLKKYQLQSLEQNGVFPLQSKDIVTKIDSAIREAKSDTSKQLLSAFKDKILSKTNEDGFISSSDLYENVRKMSNQDIAQLLNLGDKYASGGIPQQAAVAAGNIKTFIDAALDKSSNGLWSKYLKSYQAYSNKLNRMEIGQTLVDKLGSPLDKERAGVFATAVADAAGTIKKSTGIPRFEKLSDVMTPKEVAVINSVLGDLKRSTKAEQLGRSVGTLKGADIDPLTGSPALLSRWVTLGKAALEHMQRGNAEEFNKKMAELMLDPKQLAQFMTSLDKSKIPALTSAMAKLSRPDIGGALLSTFVVRPALQE